MTLQAKYNKLENDCFNLLTVDPNPPHDLNHFSLILRLENTRESAGESAGMCIVVQAGRDWCIRAVIRGRAIAVLG